MSLLVLTAGVETTYAQRPGTLRGRVVGADGDPLLGATVEAEEVVTVTSRTGDFSLVLDPGVYRLKVSFVGYQTKLIAELEVIGGRATAIEVRLTPTVMGLSPVEIVDKVPIITPGKRSITQEQINRLAATYYDPARLVASSADVAVTNDQNNSISVRGIPATYNRWRLEGVEVVNPNHLTNAGTLTDQPAGTGGGVNAISAQMLGQSQFLYGGLVPHYGNSVAGIFDLRMDSGDTTEVDFFGQASFIGFDFGAGGPLGSKGVSFRANYRYSFTGLLTSMGVDFGGEEIAFQDLSASVSIPLRSGALKLFAVGGLSSNDFRHEEFASREELKDGSDIFYDGALGIAGVSYQGRFLKRGQLSSSLAYSISDEGREEILFDTLEVARGGNNSEASTEILANHTSLTLDALEVGWDLNYYNVSNFFEGQSASGAIPDWQVGDYYLFRPFATFHWQIARRWTLTPTLSYYVSDAYDGRLEPRFSVSYTTGPGTLSLSTGLYTAFQGPLSLNDANDRFSILLDPNFVRTGAWKTSLSFAGVSANLKSDYYLEVFYYDFENIVFDQLRPGFSVLPGDYTMRGFTAHWERNFDNVFYLSGGITGFFWDEIRNDQLNFHGAGGMRKSLDKGDKKRNLNINLRLTGADQFWEDGYQYDYFRLDLRLQWVRFKSKLTESWALDVQNLLNTKNQFSIDQQGNPTYQLGFLPILAYRLDF
ncbi:MAG: TonB-dependent receptor [Bacteroidota bacterium]